MLLNQSFLAGKKAGPVSLKLAPFGPSSPAPETKPGTTTDLSQFTRTAEDVEDTMVKMDRRCRPAVFLGSTAISPESYLRTLADMVILQQDGKDLPKTIEVKPAKLASAEYVSDDNPKLWGWVIFPPNFAAPEMMQLAKRQAWTLKPAILEYGGVREQKVEQIAVSH